MGRHDNRSRKKGLGDEHRAAVFHNEGVAILQRFAPVLGFNSGLARTQDQRRAVSPEQFECRRDPCEGVGFAVQERAVEIGDDQFHTSSGCEIHGPGHIHLTPYCTVRNGVELLTR